MNGRLVLEGALRIHWGVQGVIHLKEDDDQRTVVTVRKRNSIRFNNGLEYDDKMSDEEDEPEPPSPDLSVSDTGIESGSDTTDISNTKINPCIIEKSLKSMTLPPKLDVKSLEWDELDELLQVERKIDDSEKLYQTMPVPLPSQLSHDSNDSNVVTPDTTPTSTQNDFVEPKVTKNKELPNRSLARDDSWIEKGRLGNTIISVVF